MICAPKMYLKLRKLMMCAKKKVLEITEIYDMRQKKYLKLKKLMICFKTKKCYLNIINERALYSAILESISSIQMQDNSADGCQTQPSV